MNVALLALKVSKVLAVSLVLLVLTVLRVLLVQMVPMVPKVHLVFKVCLVKEELAVSLDLKVTEVTLVRKAQKVLLEKMALEV